ncbi:MAG: sulfotransferase family 2 domain-containing protein [Opitutales bacterium]|jgi:hypothetical protein|nr:sulfotransferase family protein [Opitutales bacterium]MDG2169679.1 sulfotransferase family 2 domain-containing protein [Opitutales bacterium]
MDNFFFFIHVPKAAGITFRTIMKRNFRRQHRDFAADFYEDAISAETIRFALKQGSGLRAASSHRFTADLPYDLQNLNIVGISFLRNPVDRFISNYYYVKKLPIKNEITNSNSLEEFVASIEANPNTYKDQNLQSKTLKLSYDSLAEKLQTGQLHLFPVDKYDHSLILLQKRYPLDFRDVSYKRRNVNKSKPDTTPEDLRARIANLENIDLKLYELSKEYLDTSLKNDFQEGEIETYFKRNRRNCKIRSLFLDFCVTFSEKVHIGIRSITLP